MPLNKPDEVMLRVDEILAVSTKPYIDLYEINQATGRIHMECTGIMVRGNSSNAQATTADVRVTLTGDPQHTSEILTFSLRNLHRGLRIRKIWKADTNATPLIVFGIAV